MAKRIVLATWGSLGDLHPYMAVALALRERGHRVTIATSEVHREKVLREGLAYAPLGPHIAIGETDLIRKSMDLRRGSEFLLREIVLPYTRAGVEESMKAIGGADLFVTHSVTFGAHIAAERTGIPWLSGVLGPASFFSAFDPPVFAPSPSTMGLYSLGPWVGRAFLALGRAVTNRWMGPVRECRAAMGLECVKHPLFEGQFSPRGTLALFSSLFGAPQPDWPAHVTVTGFPFYDREPPGVAISPEMTKFFDDGPAPILFTLGSAAVFVAGDFYTQSMEAARRVGRRALLLVGDETTNPIGRPLPPGVAVFGYGRYSEVFPRAAVNVHQGGVGTTAQAMRAGRPTLVVPFSHDQPDNGNRVRKLGMGRMLFRARYNAASAARELAPLLEDASYASAAARVGETIRSENGAETAANAIEAAG